MDEESNGSSCADIHKGTSRSSTEPELHQEVSDRNQVKLKLLHWQTKTLAFLKKARQSKQCTLYWEEHGACPGILFCTSFNKVRTIPNV